MIRALFFGSLCVLSAMPVAGQYKEAYVEKFREIAISEMYRTGIPASIKLSQAILESNYGRSELAREAHNHFGIKCGRDWAGKGYSLKDDDRDARGELVHSCFRVFRSDDESFIAHSDFLKDPGKAQRYGALFSYSPDDYKSWAEGLKRSGYATNPEYARLLIRIIEEQQLFRYDVASVDEPVVSNRRKERDAHSEPNVSKVISQRQAYSIQFQNSVPYITVHGGDDVKGISKQTDVSARKIIKYNTIVDNRKSQLDEGDRIYLQPLKGKYHGNESTHMVEPGETMDMIAHFYGVKSDNLRKRNNLSEGCEPAPGSRIVLRGKQRQTIRCASDVREGVRRQGERTSVG
jgi:LysM repeat protein